MQKRIVIIQHEKVIPSINSSTLALLTVFICGIYRTWYNHIKYGRTDKVKPAVIARLKKEVSLITDTEAEAVANAIILYIKLL